MKHALFFLIITALMASTGHAQNVGIGTTNPGLGKLVVRGTVGAVAAMFGDNIVGVAIENNSPGVGFNSYYNGSRKAIAPGFGGLVGMDATTGRFYVFTAPASVATASANLPIAERLTILPNGHVGIGINTPASILDVNGRIRIRQTGITAGIGFDGKDAGNNPIIDRGFIGMVNNDYVGFYGSGGAGWGMAMNVNNGNVGIGIATPGSRLEVRNNNANTNVSSIVQEGAGSGLQVQSNGSFYSTMYSFNLGGGPALITTGKVAVNASAANSTLHVGGSVTMPVKVITDNYTATADDYSIQYKPAGPFGTQNQKTLTLPPAAGVAGRIYIISAALPFYRGGEPPAALVILDALGGNVIAKSAFAENPLFNRDCLIHYKRDFGNGNVEAAVRKLSIIVQSTGSTWIVLTMDYYSE